MRDRGQVPSVCFAAPHAYSLLDPTTGYPFGGSEVRAVLFGTALSLMPGFEVSFVTLDHGQPPVCRIGALDIYADALRLARPARSRILSALRARAAGLLLRVRGDALGYEARRRVYRRVDADIYCIFGASDYGVVVAEFCRSEGKKLVLFLGSDLDVSEDHAEGSDAKNVYGSSAAACRACIASADLIIAQTEHQADLLAQRFGRVDAVVIRNPIDLGTPAGPPALRSERRHVLWVGKADAVKRPQIALDLARSFPDVPFVVIANSSIEDDFAVLHRAAAGNVELIERVPPAEIEVMFRSAILLLNTSRFEGFPNTFLQAGKYGTPVVSLEVDPDGFLSEQGCGVVAGGDAEALRSDVAELIADDVRWADLSDRIHAYVSHAHDLRGRSLELSECLLTLARGAR